MCARTSIGRAARLVQGTFLGELIADKQTGLRTTRQIVRAASLLNSALWPVLSAGLESRSAPCHAARAFAAVRQVGACYDDGARRRRSIAVPSVTLIEG
jgi:hypothetical protein